MGIIYLSAKFEFDLSTENGDLLSDRNHWKHKNTKKPHRQTRTQRDRIWYSPNIGYRVE